MIIALTLSIIVFSIYWILIILKPSILNNLIYSINLPFVFFVGFGLITFSFNENASFESNI